jgi:hypothetical protein
MLEGGLRWTPLLACPAADAYAVLRAGRHRERVLVRRAPARPRRSRRAGGAAGGARDEHAAAAAARPGRARLGARQVCWRVHGQARWPCPGAGGGRGAARPGRSSASCGRAGAARAKTWRGRAAPGRSSACRVRGGTVCRAHAAPSRGGACRRGCRSRRGWARLPRRRSVRRAGAARGAGPRFTRRGRCAGTRVLRRCAQPTRGRALAPRGTRFGHASRRRRRRGVCQGAKGAQGSISTSRGRASAARSHRSSR